MRRSLHTSVIFVLLAASLRAQDSTYIEWDPPQPLTADTNYFHVVPQIQVEGKNVYVVWVAANTGLSFFIRSTDNGETWGDRFMLNDTTLRLIARNDFAVGIHNLNYLTDWQDSGPPMRYWLWQRRSFDAGVTWDQGHTLWDATGPRIIGYDNFRVLAYGLYPQTTVLPLFAASSDTGTTWTRFPQSLPSGREPGGMALHPPYLYLTRQKAAFGTSEVAFTLSNDLGATWKQEVFISSTDSMDSDEPHLAADEQGSVYAVWRESKYGCPNGFGCTVMFRRSTDFGITWANEQPLTSRPEGSIPRVASSGNAVAAVWYTDVGSIAGDTFLVRCRVSLDKGSTFLPMVTVNSSSIRAIDPDVAVRNDLIHVIWCQKPLATTRYMTIYYRRGRIVTTDVHETRKLGVAPIPTLSTGFPNPFNGQITIEFSLPHTTHLQVTVLNLLGQVIDILVHEERNAGLHRLRWNGVDGCGRLVASGLYVIHLQTQESTLSQKVLLLH